MVEDSRLPGFDLFARNRAISIGFALTTFSNCRYVQYTGVPFGLDMGLQHDNCTRSKIPYRYRSTQDK